MSRPDWYYAEDGEQKGPVSAENFERLIEAGVVTVTTQVWSEGMATWQPLAAVRPPTPAPAPLTSPPPPLAADSSPCALCGRGVTAEDSVQLDGRLVCAGCKPRAVQMLREGVLPIDNQAEQIRRDHIKHEASIRSVGSLQILGGAIFGLLGIGSIIGLGVGAYSRTGSSGAPVVAMMAGMSAFYLVGAVILLWVGFGLRRLKPSARIASAVLACIGLLGIPLGTLINAYILWLLLSKKGRLIFSADYRRIIAETPHIRYRTPWWAWVLLALVIGGVVVLGVFVVGFGG